MVLAIVVAIAIIMAVICFVKKKKNRRVSSHSDLTTSTPSRVGISEVAQHCSCFSMNFCEDLNGGGPFDC